MTRTRSEARAAESAELVLSSFGRTFTVTHPLRQVD
jgi:hypothetical protein